MDILAERFDLPESSPEHRDLAESCWMGGELVSLRYYLGRVLRRNLFRESDTQLEKHLVAWLKKRTSVSHANLLRDPQYWQIPDAILRFEFERDTGRSPCGKPREIAALLAVLKKPSITMPELANVVGTTEKQLKRMTTLGLLLAAPVKRRNEVEANRRQRRIAPLNKCDRSN